MATPLLAPSRRPSCYRGRRRRTWAPFAVAFAFVLAWACREKQVVLSTSASCTAWTCPVDVLQRCSASYSRFLVAQPVLAKSLTAGLIFGGADVAAQRIANELRTDWKRIGSATVVGFAFFGPAAHYWFKMILRMYPKNDIWSLLAKTAWGQVFFGPYITTVFFAAALWCQQSLSWQALQRKVAADLWPTLVAGCGYWPVVDLVGFAYMPEDYIPLFLNTASFIWTVYLAFQASRRSDKET
eukprot:TRINITY_DN27860_c0_g1_i1.p1 TRINITY_DN27860_c0_g1~~TRINITY_DN27860_c0_g1_i1.p1  ORF type:complete len:241 (+),score=22.66 TRINITY_DN27860_c0_g1_i1:57-779(+)